MRKEESDFMFAQVSRMHSTRRGLGTTLGHSVVREEEERMEALEWLRFTGLQGRERGEGE